MAAKGALLMSDLQGSAIWRFLARRLPWLGTPGVLKAVVLLNAITYLLLNAIPAYREILELSPEAVRHGEVWRLVTYIFIPQASGWFWATLYLLFMWFLANTLEEVWGALRLNTFYLLGMIGCTVAAFFFGGTSYNTFLNISLFFAFATLAPEYEIYLFFLLRLKIKYVAWFFASIMLLQFAMLPLPGKMAVVACLANYLIFFVPGFVQSVRARRVGAARLDKFRAAAPHAIHCCAACGCTEISHPEADFRVAADGEEYCTKHLPARI